MPVGDERVIVSVCDAVGHGLAAALYAARVNTFVLTHAAKSPHPCALIEDLNEFFCEHLRFSGMYANFFSVFFDTRNLTMTYTGAGHPPALHYRRATGEVSCMRSEAVMIGIEHPLGVTCAINRRDLEPGDKVLLYTDGLSEDPTGDGPIRGLGEAVEFLKTHADLDSKAFNRRLCTLLTNDPGELEDVVLFATVSVKDNAHPEEKGDE